MTTAEHPHDEHVVERFRPTSGRVTGALALVVGGAVVLIGLTERDNGFPDPVLAAVALGMVLAWASMLRPALWLTDRSLVMRGMVETVHVPLAAIEEVAARQVLAVRAGDRRHVSTVVGRSWRKAMRSSRPAHGSAAGADRPPTEVPYADFLEDRIRQAAEAARAAAGVRLGSREQVALADGVRREPAWLPIASITLAALAFAVTLVL